MPDPDYRALCAELLSELQRAVADEIGYPSPEPSAVFRARAALAQPELEEVTDEELGDLLYYEYTTSTGHGERHDVLGFARGVLARWGRPTIQPELVTVSHPLLVQLEQHARSCVAEAREANEGLTQAYWSGFLAAVMQFQAFSARPHP
jgi:hypothetical protein